MDSSSLERSCALLEALIKKLGYVSLTEDRFFRQKIFN